jgi:hypothetical protein
MACRGTALLYISLDATRITAAEMEYMRITAG